MIFSLVPTGSKSIGSSLKDENQIVIYSEDIFSFQGHPEFNENEMNLLFNSHAHLFDGDDEFQNKRKNAYLKTDSIKISRKIFELIK